MYKEDLTLNNLQGLICHKNQILTISFSHQGSLLSVFFWSLKYHLTTAFVRLLSVNLAAFPI